MRRSIIAASMAVAGVNASAAANDCDCDALRARAMICTAEERVASSAGRKDLTMSKWCDLVHSAGGGVLKYYVGALPAWIDLVDAGCGSGNDYVQIAKLFGEEMDFGSAEVWCARAVNAAENSGAVPLYAQFILGETLVVLGRPDEARPHLAAASRGHDLDMFQEIGAPESWRAATASGSRALETYSDLLNDDPPAANRYRRAAAVVALRAGLVAAERPRFDYAEAISAFLCSDRLVPLESQTIAIQMTVWRTMAIGHARLGDYVHAIEAVDRLFGLCHLDPVGQTPCPANALLPLPLTGSLKKPPSIDTGEWYLLDQNMRALGYVLMRIFESISWDPATGFPRSDAADTDFFGKVTRSGYPNGRVSSEEDRVETEQLPIAGSTLEAQCARASDRFEPFVKKFVANLASNAWWGTLEAYERPAFLGLTLQDLERAIDHWHAKGEVAEPTWQAFHAGLRAHRLLHKLIDRLNERVYGTTYSGQESTFGGLKMVGPSDCDPTSRPLPAASPRP